MSSTASKLLTERKTEQSWGNRLCRDLVKNKVLYLLVIPVIIYYIIFNYIPMYGILIAFQNYDPAFGVRASEWVGLLNFIDFFSSIYFWRILKNTFIISINTLIFGFPAPILLALLINEITSKKFVKTVQTITYLPHFISLVVVCGMIKDFTASTGIINDLIEFFGGQRTAMLMDPKLFVPIYVASDIWQGVGWGSIIYFAALSGIDSELYEACKIDGGGRIRQTFSVTLPGIMPTIIIMFILRMGSILSVGFEKIILLYSPVTYDTADVIASYVYRKGLQEFNWSFGTAVGIFNSVINVIFLLSANWISRKVSETSLW